MSLLGGRTLDSAYREPLQPRLVSPLGNLSLVTPAPTPVNNLVTVDEVKRYARADMEDHSEDDDFARLIRVNTERVQKLITGWRQLLPATYQVQLSTWFGSNQRLPLPPLRGVDWIKYFDQAGIEQTLATAFYEVKVYQRQPGAIVRAPCQNWPQSFWPLTQCRKAWPITVQFVAGYPDGQVPETLKDAIIWGAAAEWNIRANCGSFDIDDTLEKMVAGDNWGSYSGNP